MVSQRRWSIAGLVMRLAMLAVLLISIQLVLKDIVWYAGSIVKKYSDVASYNYVLASGIMGAAGAIMQIPFTVYILCKDKRTTVGLLLLEISMYADQVISLVLASGVGAGFGASIDVKSFVSSLTYTPPEYQKLLLDVYNQGIIATVFLLAGLLLSVGASVISARLRIAANDV